MISVRRPSGAAIRTFLEAQAKFGFTYAAVGATAKDLPSGYRVNHTRLKLGEGDEVFSRAKAALGGWDQFRLGWVEMVPYETPIRAGGVVAVLAKRAGLWWLNACRVVYVTDDANQYGYACGTLPDHAGTGEERFLIDRDPATGEVWYDVLAFSRPNLFLTRVGYGYMRWLQRRFGRQSAAAMQRAVRGGPA